MNAGVVTAIVGAVIGLLGGAFGTYCSVKNTKGPRERAFMIKASAMCWLAAILLLALALALPTPYRYFLWIPYVILLPIGILSCNRTQQRIRQEESQHRGQPASP